MATGWEELAGAIRSAIDGALDDKRDLLAELLHPPAPSAPDGTGVSTSDVVSIVTALFGLSVVDHPEAALTLEALAAANKAAGTTAESFGLGQFMAQAMFIAADPWVRQIQHAAEQQVTSQIYDPGTAARLVARHIIDHPTGASEASGGGFDGSHFDNLAEAELVYPNLPEAFRLRDRGVINDEQLVKAMRRNGVPEGWIDYVKHLHALLLSPADLALGNLRGDITDDDAIAYAESLGMSKEDFGRLVYNTGEPPAIMQMLELYRRGFITEERLRTAVRQSRVRDEWFESIKELRYQRMSASAAVEATVQNHLTPEQGKAHAELAGLWPDDFQVLYETAGSPLSRTEMEQLYHRGLATREQFVQALRESRLKDKYTDQAIELSRRLIPYRTINTILSHGVKDHQWGIDYLLSLGYTHEDAAALVATSTSSKTAHVKQLTEAQILTLYEARSIDREQAIDDLSNIGYNTDEAGFILEYTAAKRAMSEQNKAITYLRTGYLNHRISIQDASNAMDKLGVPPGQRDQLKTDWELERASQVKVLTVGEIGQAVRYGVVPFADAQAKLVEMGYSDNDAKVYLSTAAHGVPNGVTIDPIS